MKISLMKIGARWCGPCQALERRGTLDKFADTHPDVKVSIHDDPREDPDEGSAGRWEAFAEKWKVKALPTLIWTHGGEELFRSTDVSSAGIEQQYKRAIAKVERL